MSTMRQTTLTVLAVEGIVLLMLWLLERHFAI
jgi:hypothetical protein